MRPQPLSQATCRGHNAGLPLIELDSISQWRHWDWTGTVEIWVALVHTVSSVEILIADYKNKTPELSTIPVPSVVSGFTGRTFCRLTVC